MGGRRHRWAGILVIVTALSGCDNVSWGGVQVELRDPPQPPSAASRESPEAAPETDPALPPGPIVYFSRRTDEEAELVPVAGLRGDSVVPLPELMADPAYAARFARERMGPGAEFVLFSRGSRVGTLEVDREGMRIDSTFCAPRPRVTGVVELHPSAVQARSFVALSPEVGGEVPRTPYRALSHTYEQRVASIDVGASLIPEVGAVWPPSLLDTRRDLQAFAFQGSQEPAIAATFAYRDRLATGEAPEPSYSLFFIASHDGSAYRPAYVWYRDYDQHGKGIPRYLTHFDWDGNGTDEVLLEVFGETHRWLAVAGSRAGSWETVYQDPCGRPGAGDLTAQE